MVCGPSQTKWYLPIVAPGRKYCGFCSQQEDSPQEGDCFLLSGQQPSCCTGRQLGPNCFPGGPESVSILLAVTPIPVTHTPQSPTTCMIIYLVFFFKPKLFLPKCLLWFILRSSACIWSVDTPIHSFLIHIYINAAIKIDGSFATKIISWTSWGPWQFHKAPG